MSERTPLYNALRAHAADCEACRADLLPVERVAARLEADCVAVDVSALSQRTLERLQPALARRARAEYQRQVAAALLVGLVPLPAIALYNAYVLRLLYHLMAIVLPVGVAGYLVATYAAFLVLLFAMTYAAVPVLMGRQHRLGSAVAT